MPYRAQEAGPAGVGPARHVILAGGVGLTALAGYVNVVVLGVFSVPVSHMTGAFARLGIDVATGNSDDLTLILLIVAGFLSGAAASGAMIGDSQLQPGRRYGVALMTEAAALALATLLLVAGSRYGVPIAALACGIQNGMASSYYGQIIRTTHVTGIVTDLGVLAGQYLRRMDVEPWKPALLSGLLVGFLAGGVAGQMAVTASGPLALGAAAVAALGGGTGYFVWRTVRSR